LDRKGQRATQARLALPESASYLEEGFRQSQTFQPQQSREICGSSMRPATHGFGQIHLEDLRTSDQLLVLKDSKDLKAFKVSPAQQVRKAFRVRSAQQDPQVRSVPQDYKAQQVLTARKVYKAKSALKDLLVQIPLSLVHKVFRVK
jgi:hypothetical protein